MDAEDRKRLRQLYEPITHKEVLWLLDALAAAERRAEDGTGWFNRAIGRNTTSQMAQLFKFVRETGEDRITARVGP